MADRTELTELLAIFLAVYLMAAGLGVMIERKSLASVVTDLQEHSILGHLAAVVAFFVGAAVVAIHNHWDSFLAGLVSLVGWAALIEGVLMLAVRRRFLAVFAPMMNSEPIIMAMGIVTSVGGLVLLVYLLAT